MTHPTNPEAVRAKRPDGGWHWVWPFDPAVHEAFDAPEPKQKPSRRAAK